MAIYKRLTKLGNSSALVIDRNIMDLLGMKVGCPIKISLGTDGKSLQIQPISEEELATEGKRRFEKAKNEDLEIHSDVYRKLADR